MADVKFLTGHIDSLPQTKKQGQVYFAVDENNIGTIYFDKDADTRVHMTSLSPNIVFATCETEGNVTEKILTIDKNCDWTGKRGTILFVLFSHTNTSKRPVFKMQDVNGNSIFSGSKYIYNGNKIIDGFEIEKAGVENQILQYVYDNKGFVSLNTNNWEIDYGFSHKAYLVGSNSILPFNLIGENANGELVSAAFNPFMLGGPLYISDEELEANSSGDNKNLFDRHTKIPLHLGNNLIELDFYKPVYLKGKINGIMFVPDALNQITTTPIDGFDYIYLGEASNKTSNINLGISHYIYTNVNGGLNSYASVAGRVANNLNIGEYSYNGSVEITIPTYEGTDTML